MRGAAASTEGSIFRAAAGDASMRFIITAFLVGIDDRFAVYLGPDICDMIWCGVCICGDGVVNV